jgi:hypothetical protein
MALVFKKRLKQKAAEFNKMEVQWIDCVACKTRTHADEFEVKKGIKLKTCKRCREKSMAYYNANKCQHGKSKSKCVTCGGGAICLHKIRRSRCATCGGGEICQHQSRREKCKQCNDPRKVLIYRWMDHTKEKTNSASKRRTSRESFAQLSSPNLETVVAIAQLNCKC